MVRRHGYKVSLGGWGGGLGGGGGVMTVVCVEKV